MLWKFFSFQIFKFNYSIFKVAPEVNAPPPPPVVPPVSPSLTNIPSFISKDKLQGRISETTIPMDKKRVLAFDEVPGPPVFRHIARLWSVIPVVGTEMTASAIQYMLSAGKIFGNFGHFCYIPIIYNINTHLNITFR